MADPLTSGQAPAASSARAADDALSGEELARPAHDPRLATGEQRTLTPGEAWAREQLEVLLAARFAPSASARFLAASWRRSAATRAADPAVARRARAWTALGAAAWLGLAVAGAQPFRRRLAAGLAWWAAVSAMLDWHLGMFETQDGRARPPCAADGLTLARAWLVPVAAESPTVLVCGLGAVTDALDGWLARRAGPTRAGRDLEGLVDACFALAVLRGLSRAGRLGRAAALAEAARVSAGLAYVSFAYLGRASAPETRVAHAARSATALRFAGLVAAAASRRRLGGALLVAGSVVSVALTARAAQRGRNPSRVPRRIREPATRK